MSFVDNKIIFSDNTVLSDFSVELNDFRTKTATIPVVAADDLLFIGSSLPFNHRWFEVSTVNDQAATISEIAVWDGTEFKDVVQIIDQTLSGGVTLAQSGYISWTTDKDESWLREDTNQNGEFITGLENITIYDLYWARITFSDDLNASTALKFVGHKFANDDDLGGWYPDLNTTDAKTQFETGKTTWDDQHFQAANTIIKDLKAKNVIWSVNQILDWELFNQAAVHKLGEIIFRAFGDDFKDDKRDARNDYTAAMKLSLFNIDRNRNARLSPLEKGLRTGFMSR